MPNPTNIPANYTAPTRVQLVAQIEREKEASAMGRIKARERLETQKQGIDCSRSQGGSVLLDKCLEFTGLLFKAQWNGPSHVLVLTAGKSLKIESTMNRLL